MPKTSRASKQAEKKVLKWRREIGILQQIVDYVREHGRTHYSRLSIIIGKSPSWILTRRFAIEELFDDIYYDGGYFDILPSFKEDAEKYRAYLKRLREQKAKEQENPKREVEEA